MILETFTSFIYESFKEFEQIKVNPVIKTKPISDLPLHLLRVVKEPSTYVPDKIRLSLKNVQEYYEIHWEIELTRTTVYVLKINKLPSMKKLVKNVTLFVSMLNKLGTNKRDNVDLLLAYTGFKKRFPVKFTPLGPFHVNSGVTFRDSFCFVYRAEEMYKVILHELLHLYKIDEIMPNIAFEERLAREFKVESESIALNECYNDALACLFIIALNAIMSDPDISFKRFFKTFRNDFRQNYKYMIQVSSNILRFYRRMLLDNKNTIMKEESHVFSYYLCKAAILRNLDDFIDLLSEGLQLSQEKQRKYEYLLYVSLSSKRFKTLLETCDSKSKSLKMLGPTFL